MRKFFCIFALFLVGCTGDTDSTSFSAEHAPEISGLALSPSTAAFMDGNGTSAVTAEISFRDSGLDIQTLWVWMPDGTSMQISKSSATETGTFTETFTMPTNQVGAFPIEIWLVDKAGRSSLNHTAWYNVSDWTNRVTGLPYVLNDVVWDGAVFTAVGDGGAILTSVDGLDWIARDSGTEAGLHAVAAYGPDIFAVGQDIVLRSTDHGETWIGNNEAVAASLSAVVIDSSRVVVGGKSDSHEPISMISADRGDSWQVFNLWPDQDVGFFTDIVFRDGLLVASAETLAFSRKGWVLTSSDGAVWNSVFQNPDFGFRTIIDDGSSFTVAGTNGVATTSIDGLNWTELRTPFDGIDYHGGAWNGKKLVLAGGYSCVPLAGMSGWDCSAPQPGLPLGISTTDGGATWDLFNIDSEYRSLAMAFGNGRFVSVGAIEADTRAGAIYTAD